jgi:hypothetical protein
MTQEGWSKLLYNYSDSLNPYFLSLFFCTIILIISFFILNLLLAAIWSTFTRVASVEREKVDRERRMRMLSTHKADLPQTGEVDYALELQPESPEVSVDD